MKNTATTLAALAALGPLVAGPACADESVWLSSLDLTKATQGFGKPQADKSVDGHPLMLGGKVYAHGFGTHARGLLAVALDGGAKRFTATVGIDDEVGGGKGSAEFQVIGNGKGGDPEMDHTAAWNAIRFAEGNAYEAAEKTGSEAYKQIYTHVK